MCRGPATFQAAHSVVLRRSPRPEKCLVSRQVSSSPATVTTPSQFALDDPVPGDAPGTQVRAHPSGPTNTAEVSRASAVTVGRSRWS